METAFILIGLFGLIGIVLAKTLNVMKIGSVYSKEMVWITTAMGLIFWLLLLTGYTSSISAQESAIITDTTTTTVLMTANNAKIYLPFFSLGSLFLLLIIPLTILEAFISMPGSAVEAMTRFARKGKSRQ
jgi:hypothetical protein